MGLINYQGDSKILKRICALLKVTDVQDGEGHSLVDSNGIAVVTGGGGGSSTLAGLSDVDTTGASAGDVLSLDGTSGKWEGKTLASVALSGSYNDLSNKPTIPDELADLSDDSTHRLVADSEKTAWSAKVDDNPTFSEASTRANIASGESFATILGKIKKYFTDLATVAFSGSYNDLTHQPTIPSVSANPATTTATLTGIEIDGTNYAVQGGSANVQSDWNQTDTTADDYIKNKPPIPDAVAVKGNAESSYRTGNVNLTPANIGAVNLAGDTMTGIFTVENNSEAPFRIKRKSDTGKCYMAFYNNSGVLGYFAVGPDNKPYFYDSSDKRIALLDDVSSTCVAKSGDTMTGRLTLTKDTAEMNFRADHAAYDGVISYQTSGNEAWLFTTKNAVTSMMFVNGEDTISNVSSSRWKSLTPGLQIKNNKVAIGKLIADGTTPTHALDVNGNVQASTFNGYTIAKSVPSNAVFTDTNNAVTQTNTTGSANYRLLYSATADSTTRTEGARKGKLLVNPNVNAIFGESGQKIYFGGSDETTYWVFHGVWSGAWSLNPNGDNKLYLGQSGARWRTVYAVNGSINTSDRNKKKDIEELDDFARDFIMALKPVSYKRIDGDRTHYGMIAQDVEDSMTEFGMTSMDFAGLCKDTKDVEYYEEEVNEDGEVFKMLKHRKIEGEFDYGLRYEEFIAPLIKTVQIQQAEIEELKRRIETLEKMGG